MRRRPNKLKLVPTHRIQAHRPASGEVEAIFQRAMAVHKHGDLQQAAALYRAVLSQRPAHCETLHLLGVVSLQLGDSATALELFSKSIRANPALTAAYNNRAIALQKLGRLEESLDNYDRAIALKSDYAEAYNNRGNVLLELHKANEALESFERALALRPDYAEAHYNRGNALKRLERWEAALGSYDQSIALNATYADAHNNRGNVLEELDQFDEALSCYDNAIAIRPDHVEAHYNRGTALLELKRFEEALRSFDIALTIKADHHLAFNNRGNALLELQRFDEALASYKASLFLCPNYPQAHNNCGNALQELGRLAESLASFDEAIALQPEFAVAHYNRSAVLKKLKRLDEAIQSCDKAIALKPTFSEAYWNKSLMLLLAGNYRQGWLLYEWRWETDYLKPSWRRFSKPLWLGDADLVGKTILLHAEQGLGDTIQFCRYANSVKRLGARVLLEVPKTLEKALIGLEGVDVLVRRGDPLPGFDFHCPLLSLPLALRTDLRSIPSSKSYLKSSDLLKRLWGQRIGPRKRIRVGLAWSGSRTYKGDRYRSMTLLELFSQLPDDFEYFCLQKDVREDDIDLLSRSGIRHYGDELTFADTAALIELMDVVVSTDTSIPHLSAALGKPTWLMLPFVPDWRWMLDRDDSPWYPTMRLFRQGADRSWLGVLSRIKAELNALAMHLN